MKFDFTLYKDGRWVGTIEYNGEQHYKVVSCFGGEKQYNETQKRDLLKTKYCLEHGVPILHIQYKRLDVTVEEMIVLFLQNLDLIERN